MKLTILACLLTILAAAGGAPGADEVPAAAIDARTEALRLAACQKPDEALDICRRALEAEPERPDFLQLAAGFFAATECADEGMDFVHALVDSSRQPESIALFRGELLLAQEHAAEALLQFDRAVDGFRTREDPSGQLIALIGHGRALRSLDRTDEARAVLQEAAEMEPVSGFERYRMMALFELGGLEEDAGNWDRSIALRREALELGQEIEAPLLRMQILVRIAWAYEALGDIEHAVEWYREGVEHAETIGHTVGAIDLTTRAAADVSELGRLEESKELLRSNVARARATGDVQLEASALFNLARTLRRMGRIEQTLKICEEMRALDARSDIGLRNRSRERLVRASVLQQMGRLRESLDVLEGLDADAQELGGAWPVLVWNARANVLLDLGNIDTAIGLYEAAYEYAHERGDRRRMAIYRGNLAGCYHRLGRYQEALQCYAECTAVFQELGLGFEIGLSHLNLANVQHRVGNFEAALVEAERALATFEEIGAQNRIPSCLLTMAVIQIERNDLDEARELAERALTQAREQGALDTELQALFHLGRIDSDAGRLEAASESLLEVVTRTEGTGRTLQQTRALAALGDIELRTGKTPAALIHFEQAIEAAHQLDSPRFDVKPHVGLARCHRRLGDREEALRHYRLAIENVEKLRWGTGADEERWFVFGGNTAAYAEAALLLLEIGTEARDPEALSEAFVLAEMGRARTLMDRLEQLGIDVDQGVPTELRQERSENLERYNYVHAQLMATRADPDPEPGQISGDSLAREELEAELRRLDEEYERIEGRIRQIQSPLAELRAFEAASDERVRDLLPPGAILLEYVFHEDSAWVFLVSRTNGLDALKLPTGIEARIGEFRAQLEAGQQPRDFQLQPYCDLAHDLYLALVAPVLDRVDIPVTTLIVAADGPLWTVPFEAFLSESVEGASPGRLAELPYLFRDVAVSYVPSSTAWRQLRERTAPSQEPDAASTRPTLVFANPTYPDPESIAERGQTAGSSAQQQRFPPLPHSLEEAERIAGVLGSDRSLVITGEQATEDRIKAEPLANYRRIHFAAHSYIDEEHAQRSAVVLSLDEDLAEDGFLTIREIYDLSLDAELVVLSACSSAGGKPIRGEGMIALARPFLAAGAASSVVTLWPISDRSTPEFMGAFYRSLATGVPSGVALQAARAAMLESPRPAWRLPYHWASFVLVGGS